MIKLVIFDLDGTLLDSIDAIVQSFKIAAEAFNAKIDLDVVRSSIGIPSREILRKALKTEVSEQVINKILILRRKLHDELIMNAKLFKDVLPVLLELRRRGFKLALVSSNVRYRLEAILARNRLSEFFDTVVSYEDVERPKPHPDMVFKALRDVRVSPRDALLVGDSVNDVISAKKAGVIAVLIDRYGNRESVGEDFKIRNLKELLKLIERLDC